MAQRQKERSRRLLPILNRRRQRYRYSSPLQYMWHPYPRPYHELGPVSSGYDGTDPNMYVGAAGLLEVPRPRLQEADPGIFLYCFELPGFQCRTSLTQQWLSASQIRQFNGLNLSLFSGFNSLNFMPNLMGYGAVHNQPLPQYTMVKVGITSKLSHPAKRVYDVMRGLKKIGASEEETKFASLQKYDSLNDTFTKGKREDNVIFFKKCCDVGDVEKKIRQLIGRDLGEKFRDQFKECLGGDDDGRQRYVDQVGITEWVLVPTHLITDIKQEFRRDWSQNSMFVNTPEELCCTFNHDDKCQTGQQFCRQIESIAMTMSCQLHGNLAQEAHKVTITFPPTNFSFDVDIIPPKIFL